MFISFEGIDGCGKSTQVRLLEQYLQGQGHEVVVLREPGATPLSESIRTVLLDTKVDIDPMAELLLFCASRRQLVQQVIRPALERSAVVICDRYLDSSTAYQGYGRGLVLEDVAQANALATGGLLPAITFFLDISVELSYMRAAHRQGSHQDRMEQSGREFFSRVRIGYQNISAQDPSRVYTIDGSLSIEDIRDQIQARLLTQLPSQLRS